MSNVSHELYKFAHKEVPHGTGRWAFRYSDGQTYFITGQHSYIKARGLAVVEARRMGLDVIEVLP
jgi:hypothetical protein